MKNSDNDDFYRTNFDEEGNYVGGQLQRPDDLDE